jgi:hypothetical protein
MCVPEEWSISCLARDPSLKIPSLGNLVGVVVVDAVVPAASSS